MEGIRELYVQLVQLFCVQNYFSIKNDFFLMMFCLPPPASASHAYRVQEISLSSLTNSSNPVEAPERESSFWGGPDDSFEIRLTAG